MTSVDWSFEKKLQEFNNGQKMEKIKFIIDSTQKCHITVLEKKIFIRIFTNHAQLFVLVQSYYVWSLCSAFPVPVVEQQKICETNSFETKQDSTAGGSDEIVSEVLVVAFDYIVVVGDNEDSTEPTIIKWNFKKDTMYEKKTEISYR